VRYWIGLVILALATALTPGAVAAASDEDVYIDPAPQEDCDAILTDHPEFAGQPCVITTTVKQIKKYKEPKPSGISPLATYVNGWWYFDTFVSTTGPFNAWAVTTSFGGKFNGFAIWSRYVSCSSHAGVYSLDITWCSVWNNGGQDYPYYADWGANWKLCYAAVLCSTYYHREAIDRSGNIIRIARGH
jgi:hypothetical protein